MIAASTDDHWEDSADAYNNMNRDELYELLRSMCFRYNSTELDLGFTMIGKLDGTILLYILLSTEPYVVEKCPSLNLYVLRIEKRYHATL